MRKVEEVLVKTFRQKLTSPLGRCYLSPGEDANFLAHWLARETVKALDAEEVAEWDPMRGPQSPRGQAGTFPLYRLRGLENE